MASSHADLIIRIHGIAGARAACRVIASVPFTLLSPPNAAMSLGAGWFGAVIDQVRREFPNSDFKTILDCRGRVLGALAAIEIGLDGVIIEPQISSQFNRLSDLGAQSNCHVALDLPKDSSIYEMSDDVLPDHELDRRLRLHLTD